MKLLNILILVISFSLMSLLHADGKNAVMMDKVEDPFAGIANIMGTKNAEAARKSMGSEGVVIEYKHCIQNIKTKGFLNLYEALKEEASEDGEYNDVKSMELIETCPLPANGACDHGDRIEYFYTSSNSLLEDQREGCEYFKKKWATFDAKGNEKK